MENFQDAVAAIVKALPEWEKKGLNEAQTSQSIILRLLAAAGYDIWNPFEVLPQHNQDRSIPDFIIAVMGINKFVVEVKALDKALIRISRVQATTYASQKKRLRWSILSNGKQWEFLDNDMDHEDAGDRIALVLNLLEPRSGEFLSTLLDRQLWEKDGANERIAKQVQVISITMEVSKNFPNQEGVELAIHHALHPKDNSVATSNPSQVAEPFFPKNTLPVEIPAAPITQVTPQTEALLNVWQVLYGQLEAVQQKLQPDLSKRKNFYTIHFNNHQINMSGGMANVYKAVAETCLVFKRDKAIRYTRNLTSGIKTHYRLLSNGQYILVNLNVSTMVKQVRLLLQALEIPAGSVTISSNNKGIHVLP